MSQAVPIVAEVERQLASVVTAQGGTRDEVASLTRLWHAAAAALDVSQTPGTWAAAVYYAYLRIRFDGATQAEAAGLFGVSVQSVTAKFGQIDATLQLEAYDARYTPAEERPEIVHVLDEVLRPFQLAHERSSHHRPEVEASEVCGCFYCLATFAPSAIDEWIDEGDGGETALCPKCGIDAVLGSASGLALTPGFLRQMHEVWF